MAGKGDAGAAGVHALSLADVLEEEQHAITGENPEPAAVWEFDAAQILDAEGLRARLIEGRDPAARGLAGGELRGLVGRLRAQGAPQSEPERAGLRAALAAGFNALLEDAGLYAGEAGGPAARFAGVRFRPQTRERIAAGPLRERNRLVLEDAFPELERREDARLGRIFARAHRLKLAALCLSGGGIRSASFALGVVQGLARLGLLGRFHYLSTVSGGGYLGGWLSAWMRRAGRERVIAELTGRAGRPLEPEPAALSHLRAHASYLSPRLGLASTDAWTLAAIYLRNLLLNWLVLVPLLAAALVVPQLLVALTRLPHREAGDLFAGGDVIFFLLLALGFACSVASVRYVHAHRPMRSGDARGAYEDPKQDHRAFMRGCFLPMLGALVGLTVVWAWVASGKVPALALPEGPAGWQLRLRAGEWSATFHAAWVWAGGGALLHFGGWLLAGRLRSWREFAFILATGALGGMAAGVIAHGLVPSAAPRSFERLEQYAWYVSFAAPALLATVLVFGHLYVGFTSRSHGDPTFEWTARYSAWLQIAIAAWLAACGVVLLAPLGLARGLDQVADSELVESAQLIASLLGAAAGAVTLRQAFKSPLGAGRKGEAGLRARLVQALALPVFVVLLLALLSHLAGWLMDLPGNLHPFFRDLSCAPADPASPARHYHGALNAVVCGSLPSALLVLGLLLAGGYLMSLRIDTNRFSLHGMYRARLIRSFLGASRTEQERDPNRFTGFDESDDMGLTDLWRAGQPAPLHVVNAALNLVTRDELASQQRKAKSFTFSALHCGAAHLGYRPTRAYGGGITLGTAVTISGAAASPEMGYHSKPLLSFLLTLFNIRLGWWLGNPGYSGRHSFGDAAPASSMAPIIDEALGRTDDRNPYVYLSDGGHFENLGLYEMVLRRCRWIVVSDAGCDPRGVFEDLGNAIRRIRVDFGIPIRFAGVPIYAREEGAARAPGATYCAVGHIRYSAVDGDVQDGTLVYIKPAYYGSEPPDVFNYGQASPAFPHESTANQFFTEAQLESYRRLGTYILDHVTRSPAAPGEAAREPRRLDLGEFASRLEAELRRFSGTRSDRRAWSPGSGA